MLDEVRQKIRHVWMPSYTQSPDSSSIDHSTPKTCPQKPVLVKGGHVPPAAALHHLREIHKSHLLQAQADTLCDRLNGVQLLRYNLSLLRDTPTSDAGRE